MRLTIEVIGSILSKTVPEYLMTIRLYHRLVIFSWEEILRSFHFFCKKKQFTPPSAWVQQKRSALIDNSLHSHCRFVGTCREH